MLIKAFGLYWNPDLVDWGSVGAGNVGNLPGKVKINSRTIEIDFWKSKGIYTLHADFKTVYVGRAFDTAIGKRLRDHLSDRFAGRLDMFSWYSISRPRISKGDVSTPGRRWLGPASVVDALEALAILVTDPALNRKRERLRGAVEATQPKRAHPLTVRAYLEKLLGTVEELAGT